MSDTLQLGQHPDADQLSAFAEQALPAHERERTLAHLANCAACREIVALSLPPLEASPIAVPGPVLSPGFGGWFSGWRLVWLAAPALAALLLLTIYLHRIPASDRRPAEQADLAVSPPPIGKSPLQPAGAPSAMKTAVPAAPAAGAAKPGRPAPPSVPPGEVSLPMNGRNFGFVGAPVAPAQTLGGPVAVHGSAGGAAGGMGEGIASGNGAGLGHGASAPLQQSPTAAPSGHSLALDLATAAQPPAAAAASPAAAPASPAPSAGAFSALRKSDIVSTLAPLPSGLPVASSVADLHRRVALDTQHALFLSDDDGRHWRPVPSPWPGHAIAVLMSTPATPHPAIISAGAVPSYFSGAALASSRAPTRTLALPSIPLDLSGGLSGMVTDATGAAIPGASVVVKGGSSSATPAPATPARTAKTDASGRYLFAGLAPGSYQIEAAAPGFERQSLNQEIAASQRAVANLKLTVGEASQTVTVEASSNRVEIEPQSAVLPASAAKIVAAPAPAPAAKQFPPVFVVLTDTGERWTSPDGQSWQLESAKRN